MAASQTEKDLAAERARASFPVKDLSVLLQGGPAEFASYEKIIRLAENDPLFRNTEEQYFIDRRSLYKLSLQRYSHYIHETRHGKLRDLSPEEHVKFHHDVLGFNALSLHIGMFLPILQVLCDEEQAKKWIPLAENWKIIGCYAQTELGHGSNVQGLETTATFDSQTDDFVIHSPTISSTKYWPGALGRTATHAVVYARLLLPNRDSSKGNTDHGVHPFLVQLRSLEDHKTLPGISAGDIGSKFGSLDVDNGFCRFDHVRIPRRQMLMKFSKVTRDGKFSVEPGSERVSFAAMMSIRTSLITDSSVTLSKACTIATRYCAVRRQFTSAESAQLGLEQQVLDFQAVQYRLFPLIATAYAIHFTAVQLKAQWKAVFEAITRGDLSGLKEIHTTLSGLKAVATTLSADGQEECRRATGGAGYSRFSGLPDLLSETVAAITVEGENHMIIQQSSQHLIKVYQDAIDGKELTGNTKYLGPLLRGPARVAVAWKTLGDIRLRANLAAAYEYRAANKLRSLVQGIQNLIATRKISFGQAYNQLQWEAIQTARVHGMATIVRLFADSIDKLPVQQSSIQVVLDRLFSLFALTWIEKDLGDFLEGGYLPTASVPLIREAIRNILDELRPDAIALVDAFAFADFQLRSAIGRFDGKVYETMLEWAKREPLNQTEVVVGYNEYIRPILQAFGSSKASETSRL